MLPGQTGFCKMKYLGVPQRPPPTPSPGWDVQDTQHEVTRGIATPPGWDASLSQDTQHEVTRGIATPPGWDASLSQDTQHEVTRGIATDSPWMGC